MSAKRKLQEQEQELALLRQRSAFLALELGRVQDENARLRTAIDPAELRRAVASMGGPLIERMRECWEIVGAERAYLSVRDYIERNLDINHSLTDDARRAFVIVRDEVERARAELPKAPAPPFGPEGLASTPT